tara:strand:- start:300 stop:479 length:180 start_codon:yes stop_codon:yes gene_type:complete
MAHTEGFYIENDVHEILKMSCKKRGDKSKIINEALKKYLNMIYPEDKPGTTEVPKIIIE